MQVPNGVIENVPRLQSKFREVIGYNELFLPKKSRRMMDP
jgi:hypothetical protein